MTLRERFAKLLRRCAVALEPPPLSCRPEQPLTVPLETEEHASVEVMFTAAEVKAYFVAQHLRSALRRYSPEETFRA